MSRVARELLEALLLALIVFLLIQTSVQNFKVEGSSMEPTLQDRQYLLVNKLAYFPIHVQRLSRIVPFWDVESPSERFAVRAPERGEVIVFRFPEDETKDFVKRVIGLPGDLVEIRDGAVYVNEVILDEPYLTTKGTHNMRQVRLGEEGYFVLGDNRSVSNDSRKWGPVPKENVLGKVWFVYWPFSELNLLDSFSTAAHGLLR